MRIVYVANGSNNAQRYVNYFAQKGYEVHLICREVMAGYDENVHIHLLNRTQPRVRLLSQYLDFLSWISQTRRFITEIKPDIIDGHYATIYGFLAASSGFHPLVITAMGSDILIDPKKNILLKFLLRYVLKKADIVICNAETIKKKLLEFGTRPENVRLIYNGIDTQQFSPQMKDDNIRKKWNLDEGPLVISIRNLRPIYNVEMLIKAVPLVLRQLPEVKFLIGGDGELRDHLKNLANSLGVLDSVIFAGYIPHTELPKYLASSDVYVSNSLSDGTSFSLQEAMACELAPVVTDLSANREWISDGENGFIVPINDIQALATKIVHLLSNHETRKKFGSEGRKIIQTKAEYQQEMNKMDRIYQELMRVPKQEITI
jgi:glycosyltransferase involved in cell wall biosynthesis